MPSTSLLFGLVALLVLCLAHEDDYPVMVSLHSGAPDSPFCTGTIIRSEPLAVLTAAHCVFGVSDVYADIGYGNGGNEPEQHIMHTSIPYPNASSDSFDLTRWNDAAVLFFATNTDHDAIQLDNEPGRDLSGTPLAYY